MENLKDYITDKINQNQLSFDIDETLVIVEKLREVYPTASDYQLFFHFILNQVGSLLKELNVEKDIIEYLGWLRVKISRKGIVYYQFEDEEDYYFWLSTRVNIYNQLIGSTSDTFHENISKIRLLNFMELSTMNVITDIVTKKTYSLMKPGQISKPFKKDGWGVNCSNNSFIKYVGTSFKEGYCIIPTE